MGVFKEEVIALEELSAKQVRIYPDSCDYGVYATPEVKKTVRTVLEALLPLSGNGVSWRQDLPSMTQREYKLRVYWNLEEGTDITILYVNDRMRKKEFFEISLHAFQEIK